MKLLKFGGTSVGSPESITQVIEIIKGYSQSEQLTGVVVSAFSGITDHLKETAELVRDGEQVISERLDLLADRHLSCAASLLGHSKFAERDGDALPSGSERAVSGFPYHSSPPQ